MKALAAELVRLLGEDGVVTAREARERHSQDVWTRGGLVDLVVRPKTQEAAAAALAACARAGVPVYPRGGGMSYTAGYLGEREGGVSFDTSRLTRIVEIEETDRFVRVEAGCTWAALHAALKPKGLRTPFWGPLSGLASTIGGGVSQNNAFFGAGSHGPTGQSVLSVSAALPDGSILRTGSAGQRGGSAFFRHDGPDLTGLFVGDCGALGVKLEITLRLVEMPAHEAWGSFSFAAPDAMARAASAMARTGLACEIFGFDPGLTAVRMQRASILSDAKTLAKVVTGQKTFLKGAVEGARMALAGRTFLSEADFNLHFVTEGHSKAGVEEARRRLAAICEREGGKAVEPTIPKVIRANPFTPLNTMIGPNAERWVPVHGIVPHSKAVACWAAIEAYFASLKDRFEAEGVTTGTLITTLGETGFLIEPVFLWPDALFALHEESVEAGYLKKLERRPDWPAATALVGQARAGVVDIFTRHCGVHFQIGRTYPFAKTRRPETLALLRSIKAALDPDGIVNPGVLGLGGGS